MAQKRAATIYEEAAGISCLSVYLYWYRLSSIVLKVDSEYNALCELVPTTDNEQEVTNTINMEHFENPDAYLAGMSSIPVPEVKKPRKPRKTKAQKLAEAALKEEERMRQEYKDNLGTSRVLLWFITLFIKVLAGFVNVYFNFIPIVFLMPVLLAYSFHGKAYVNRKFYWTWVGWSFLVAVCCSFIVGIIIMLTII